MKTRRHRRMSRKHKGGGYGFGGSIMPDAGGPGAGNVDWVSDTGKDCGAVAGRGGNNLVGGRRRRTAKRGGQMSNAALAGRGGNNVTGGRRRRGGTHKMTKEQLKDLKARIEFFKNERLPSNTGPRRSARLAKKKGGADLAQTAPRTGYGFNGTGVAGTANTIPY